MLTRRFGVCEGVWDPFKAPLVVYFTLFRVADPFRHLYSCMSRRGEEEKTKNFFGVSPSQKRLNDFQLYSVLVSCLEESQVAGW